MGQTKTQIARRYHNKLNNALSNAPPVAIADEVMAGETLNSMGRTAMKDLLSSLPKSPDFLAFWKLYPLKRDKLAAANAYAKARRIATHEEIMDGLERYPFRDDPSKRPYPATWLNRGGWMHEDDTPPPTVIVNGHGKYTSLDSTFALRGDCDESGDDGPIIDHDPGGYR